MILRRLTQQVQAQNWFAVGLDFFIVVIGVFIGIQVANWNDQRSRDAQMEQLLGALHSELTEDIALIERSADTVAQQYQANESIRRRVADPSTDLPALVQIMRHEFDPSWVNPQSYNSNAYSSLSATGLLERAPAPLRDAIKTYYVTKASLVKATALSVADYRDQVRSHVNRYTFGSNPIHDQGPLIDRLIWESIDPAHLAAAFNSLSNYKRIMFGAMQNELDYSLQQSRKIVALIEHHRQAAR